MWVDAGWQLGTGWGNSGDYCFSCAVEQSLWLWGQAVWGQSRWGWPGRWLQGATGVHSSARRAWHYGSGAPLVAPRPSPSFLHAAQSASDAHGPAPFLATSDTAVESSCHPNTPKQTHSITYDCRCTHWVSAHTRAACLYNERSHPLAVPITSKWLSLYSHRLSPLYCMSLEDDAAARLPEGES